jgi:hypothetical protein
MYALQGMRNMMLVDDFLARRFVINVFWKIERSYPGAFLDFPVRHTSTPQLDGDASSLISFISDLVGTK